MSGAKEKRLDELQAIWTAWLYSGREPFPVYLVRLQQCLPEKFTYPGPQPVELSDLLRSLQDKGLIEETLDRTIQYLTLDWNNWDAQTRHSILETAKQFADARYRQLVPLSATESAQLTIPWAEAEVEYLGERAQRFKDFKLQGLDLESQRIVQVGVRPIGEVFDHIPKMIADLISIRAKWDVAAVTAAAPSQLEALLPNIVENARTELRELCDRAIGSIKALKPSEERNTMGVRTTLAGIGNAINGTAQAVIDTLNDPFRRQSLVDSGYVASLRAIVQKSQPLPAVAAPVAPIPQPDGEAPALVKLIQFFFVRDNWRKYKWAIALAMLIGAPLAIFPMLRPSAQIYLLDRFVPWTLSDEDRVDAVLEKFSPKGSKDNPRRNALVFALRNGRLTLPRVIDSVATAVGGYSSTLPADRKQAVIQIYRDTLGCALSDEDALKIVAQLSVSRSTGGTENNSKKLFDQLIHRNLEEESYKRAWGRIDKLPLTGPFALRRCSD